MASTLQCLALRDACPDGLVSRLLQWALALVLMTALACGQESRAPFLPAIPTGPDPIGEIDVSGAAQGIVALPASVDARLRAVFDRYTRVLTPSGRPIHILAQSGWRTDQIVRARKVLEHMLAPVPGSRLGADKTAVAEAMADRRATLVLFDDIDALERAFDDGLDEIELGCQDLRANECPVEGDADFMVHDTRDAAFEEILHLVHDYGIRPTLPEYDEALHQAHLDASRRGLWQAWPDDEPENQRNEYFAAVYDNMLDLWAVTPRLYEGEIIEPGDVPEGSSHFGAYGANTRARVAELDPVGYALIADFLPLWLTYTVELPPEFEGSFSIMRDEALPYTASSQHLLKVAASGSSPVQLIGNDGPNAFSGGAGDDVLRGGEGLDVVILRGPRAEYTLAAEDGGWRLTDSVAGRDGSDRIHDVELLRFNDQELALPVDGAPASAGN